MSTRHSLQQIQALDHCNMLNTIANRVGIKHLLPAVGLLLCLFCSSAFAQIDEPASLKAGESQITPIARFEYRQSNNAFLTENDPTETTAFVIKPNVSWVADRRLLSLKGAYDGEYASYSEEILNYTNHRLSGLVNAEVSSRTRLQARLALDFGHQPLGTGFTRGIADSTTEPVEYLNTNFLGSYTYGAEQARGNFTLGLGIGSRAYQNQEALTRGWGYTSVRPYGQFSLRISGDTRAITTIQFSNFTYENSNNDRNDISLLAGLRFAATGRSGGEFQLGSTLTNFAQESRTDKTSFVAEAELFFQPSEFSRFELSASRALENDADSPLDSSTVLKITDKAKLNWRHEWSSRFYHEANLSYEIKNGDCPTTVTRDLASAGIEFNLVVQRWLHVGASVSGRSREVTLCPNVAATDVDLDFESQVIGAHIRATL